jgi:hypothetical protein
VKRTLGALALIGGLLATQPGCGVVVAIWLVGEEVESRWDFTGPPVSAVTDIAVVVTPAELIALEAGGARPVGTATARGGRSRLALCNRTQSLGASNGATHCAIPPDPGEDAREDDDASVRAECVYLPPERWAALPGPLRPGPRR